MSGMSDDELLEAVAPLRWSRAWWKSRMPAVAGILGTGIIVNAIWETIARPGLGWFARFVVNASGSLSETLANSPFENAALDPDTLPSSGLLVLVLCVMCGLMGIGSMRILFRGRIRAGIDRQLDEVTVRARTETEAYELRSSFFARKTRFYGSLMVFLSVMSLGSAVFVIANVQASLEVSRVHRANIAILRPHLEAHDIDVLDARFASMKTKADYGALRATMNEMATKVGVELRQVQWFRP